MEKIKKIAINTGGGDAPGLNAVIRAVVLSARNRGWEVYGIRRSYHGLLGEDEIVQLSEREVRGITHQGGTILGTTNRGDPFHWRVGDAGQTVDRSDEVVEAFHRHGFDALIAVGGDGSLGIAHRLAQKGIPVVGVPKTIDNDIVGTALSFGFLTAVFVATDAIDRLHSTAEAHERVMVVEVMGRNAGWIALFSGVAGTADAILIPEIPFRIDEVCAKIRRREEQGQPFAIVVVAEGARPVDGKMVFEDAERRRLGGIGEIVAREIQHCTGKDSRCIALRHLQRGGSPISYDRLIALRFGAAAVGCVAREEFDVMVALSPPEVETIPLEEAVKEQKRVPLDSDVIATGRALGICFGD